MTKYIIITLSLLLIQCSKKVHYDIQFERKYDHTKLSDSIGEIEIKETILAREVCLTNIFDMFCYNRLTQLFVHLNTDNFLLSYDSFVYEFVLTSNILKKLDSLKFDYSLPWIMDTLFNHNIQDSNLIQFKVPKHYKRKVKRYARKYYNSKFDGTAKYALYKIKFECIYLGKRHVYLSNMERKKSKRRHLKICEIYSVLNILELEPISKEMYFDLQRK